MIQIKNLSKSFEGQKIIKNVNLEIYDNETLVILGPSGQGKTVFIKTIVRLFEPDSGEIIFDGINICSLKKRQLDEFRKKIAFVFQNSALFDFLDVRENLGLYLSMYKNKRPNEIEQIVLKALNFVGLDRDVLEKYPEELSGGMKKRVAIARALIKRPKYIFYDEPTTGLDKANAEKVSRLINLFKNEINTTSIVVTHDIQLMKDVADRVALLSNGRIEFIGKKEEIDNEKLSLLYNGGEINGL